MLGNPMPASLPLIGAQQWSAHVGGTDSSTSPHRSAVAGSIVRPDSTRYAVRHRPMRRVMLTVPPAPGIRPRLSSGRPSTASGRACTHPQNAAISSPLPSTWPCTSARQSRPSRAVSSSSTSAGLCRVRARCALAGSAKVPNSARSPPLQNDGPLPRQHDLGDRRVERATSSASSSAARASVENALCRCGRLNRTCRRSPSRSACTGSGMSGTVRGPAFGEPARELRPGLQRRVGQRLGDDAGQRGSPRRRRRAARRRTPLRPAASVGSARSSSASARRPRRP